MLKRRALQFAIPIVVSLLLPDRAAGLMAYCWWNHQTTYTCSDSGCDVTVHWWQSCIYWESGGGGGTYEPYEPGGGGGSAYPGDRYGDWNTNGILDDWSAVVDTADPCAYNLDYGDRLGSDHGGPNDSCCAPAGETGRSWHNGVDIQGDLGDPVHAIRSGYVERAGDDGTGCGYSIRIRHDDGSSSTYCHMSFGSIPSNLELTDARVIAGARIGSIGDTGSPPAGAYHLHLVYRDAAGNVGEFMPATEQGPTADQLNPEGC